MLSRGKGVPDETRAAYGEIRSLLETRRDEYAVTGLRTERIGLEGETRLCIEFDTQRDAETALAVVRKRVSGIDLLQVAETPCPPQKEYKP